MPTRIVQQSERGFVVARGQAKQVSGQVTTTGAARQNNVGNGAPMLLSATLLYKRVAETNA
jgi:hypothetical protein